MRGGYGVIAGATVEPVGTEPVDNVVVARTSIDNIGPKSIRRVIEIRPGLPY